MTLHVVCHAASDILESMSRGISVFLSSKPSTQAPRSWITVLLITATRLPGFTPLFSTRQLTTNASPYRSKSHFIPSSTYVRIATFIQPAPSLTARSCYVFYRRRITGTEMRELTLWHVTCGTVHRQCCGTPPPPRDYLAYGDQLMKIDIANRDEEVHPPRASDHAFLPA